jgi:hypothetical protein
MFSKYATTSSLISKDVELEKLLDELVSVHNEYTHKTRMIIQKIKHHKMSDRDVLLYESDMMRNHNNVPLYEMLHPSPVRSDSKVRNRGVSEPDNLDYIKMRDASMISHV